MQAGLSTLYHVLWFFYIYAFTGWCIEVVFCSVNTGSYVNRGFLNGPVCPIYGFGAVIVLSLLSPFEDNIVILFVCSVVVTSALEFVTGFALEKLFHTRWWDYSDQPFNIKGYVCLKFSLAWGFACLLLVKVFHPLILLLVNMLPEILGIIFLSIFSLTILYDLTVTILAVRRLNIDLKEITKLSETIHSGSEHIAEKLGNSAISLSEKIDQLDLDGKKQELTEGLAQKRDEILLAIESKREDKGTETPGDLPGKTQEDSKLGTLLSQKSPVRRRLLKAFPDMKNLKHPDALELLRNSAKKNSSRKNK